MNNRRQKGVKMNKYLKIYLKFCLFCLLFLVCTSLVGCKGNIESASKDLTKYTLNLTYDDQNHKLVGSENVDYVNDNDVALGMLCFHLYPNAFSENAKTKPVSVAYTTKAYPNGKSYGNITVLRVCVEGVEQEVVIGEPDDEVLIVTLPQQIYPDERVNVDIDFEVILPNCLHRFGYGDNTINFGNFYPIACVYENGDFKKDAYGSNGDPFYSEMSNYDVSITFNNKFKLASTGDVVGNEVNENMAKMSICANAVRDFAFVLSEKFSVISDKVGKTTVNYFYYDDKKPEKSLKAGVDAIKTFNNLFGEYPYKTYNIAKTNFIHGGMEYPNLVFISDSVEGEFDYLNVIVHETAHQWWYNMVGSNACEYAWLDEGLTEYSTLLFYKNNPEYNVDVKKSLNNSLSSYLLFSEIYNSVYGKFDESMSRNVNAFRGDTDYVYITYVKGVLFFDNLNELVGDKNFVKALRLYFKENCYKNATPEDMISCFERACKRNLEAYFDSWIKGKVILQNYA